MVAPLIVLALAIHAPAADDLDAKKAAQKELDALKGDWVAVKVFGPNGLTVSADEMEKIQAMWAFGTDGKSVFSAKKRLPGGKAKYTYSIDASKSPKEIDLTEAEHGWKQFGIYKIEKGTLTLCWTTPRATAEDRPKEFAVKGKTEMMLEMKRPEKK